MLTFQRLNILLAVLLFSILGCQTKTDNSGTSEADTYDAETDRPSALVPQGENGERPVGWLVRLDREDPDVIIGSVDTADIFFVNMTPGWHVTTSKSAIYYHPANTARGIYTASARIHLFDPGESMMEGYGMIFGGRDLDNDNQAYRYFLIRNTGEFLVKRRNGSETAVIKEWTPSDAIVLVESGGESKMNELMVHARPDSVIYDINGARAWSEPRSGVEPDGILGLRVNHGLNLHIEQLGVAESG